MFPCKKEILLIIFTILSLHAFAAKIKGTVTDKQSGDPLIGAVIVLEHTKYGTTAGLDGSFTINDVPTGEYELKVEYTGYEPWEQKITVGENELKVNIKVISRNAMLKEVSVMGKYIKGSDEEALNKEKTSDVISNIVSARTIQISPDVTVATVIQRVSGVSIVSGGNNGGQYAIIRGMDRRYNTTLVNGVKIPSPDNRDRYVPLDMFPSELLERLEVNKTLTPSMEGDASGGVINLVMKNAPDKFICDANLGVGYGNIWQNRDFAGFNSGSVNRRSPAEIYGPGVNATMKDFPYDNLVTHSAQKPVNSIASFTIGDRFLKNKLGAIASASFQNTYDGYNSISFLQSPTLRPAPGIDTPLHQTFSDLNVRRYSTLSQRLGVMSKFDYDINDKNSLSLFVTYLQLNEFRVMETADSQLGGGYTPSGFIGNTAIHHRIQTRSILQSILNATLQGKHQLTDNLSTDWSLVASEAKREVPDMADFSYSQKNNPDLDGNPHLAPPVVSSMNREWMHNTDKDLAAYLNFHYTPGFLRGLNLIDFGGLYRHKTRDNYDNAYTGFVPVNDSNSVQESYTSLQNSQFILPGNYGLGNAAGNGGIYSFHENVLAYYALAHYDISNHLSLLGGLRVENTNAGYVSSLPVTVAGKEATYVYTDFLPSLQAKYKLTDKSAIRASYFRSIYRPAFSDLINFPDNSANDDYGTNGNDTLQHTVVDNADIRYELFPGGLDQVMVGAFYKFIQNPIEYAIVSSGFTEQQFMPANFGNAQNYGIELVFKKYFGSFGVSGNYTYTKSVITTDKELYYLDNNGTTINGHIKQTRPLQGQADHVGNLSLLYRGSRNKIEAQLAFVYVGNRIFALSPYYNLDTWEKPTLTMDFSIQKQFGKRFIVYAKANNLLNTGLELYINQHNQAYNKLYYQESQNYLTVQKDFHYASFLFGVRVKF